MLSGLFSGRVFIHPPSHEKMGGVGDITIRYDPPRWGQVIPMASHDMKPKRILKMAVHRQGPKAQGRLKARRYKPPYM